MFEDAQFEPDRSDRTIVLVQPKKTGCWLLDLSSIPSDALGEVPRRLQMQ